MPKYFAFGSNLDLAQMATRLPGAVPVTVATLHGYHLVFRGPSRKRGGGVASVDRAPDASVPGMVYDVTMEDLLLMDRYEGAPHWYLRVGRTVVSDDGAPHSVHTYRLPAHVTAMPPTPAYIEQIHRAYAHHGFERSLLHEAVERSNGTVEP